MKKSNNNSAYSSPIKQLQNRYQQVNTNNGNNDNDFIIDKISHLHNEKNQSSKQSYINQNQYQNQTPAKNLAEEEFYKLKALRLQQQNQQLKGQIKKLKQNNHELLLDNQMITKQLQKIKNQNTGRIMPTIPLLNLDKSQKNIKPLIPNNNNQIQTDNQTNSNNNKNQNITINQSNNQVEKLLKQIRMLKNNHELQINNFQQLNKKLRKRIVQLQQKKSTQDLYQQNPLQIDYNTIKLEKIELTQQFNKQKEQNMSLTSQIQNLKNKICTLNQTINNLMENQRKIIQEEVAQIRKSRSRRIEGLTQNQNYYSQKDGIGISISMSSIDQKLNKIAQNRKKLLSQNQNVIHEEMQNQESQIKISREKQYQYFSKNQNQNQNQNSNKNKNKKNNMSNQQELLILKLKNQIKQQRFQQESKEIQTKNTIQNLKYKVQRLQKQLSDKDEQLHQILTKLKPLLNKENQQQSSSKDQNKTSNKDTIEKSMNIRSGMTLLQVFLQKNRMLN